LILVMESELRYVEEGERQRRETGTGIEEGI
jgi:hypothetical protein